MQFVTDCRSVGISAPILPGIMPVMAYGGFKRMTGFCKTAVPAWVNERMEEIKDDDEAVKRFGIELGTQMCKQLLAGGAPGSRVDRGSGGCLGWGSWGLMILYAPSSCPTIACRHGT